MAGCQNHLCGPLNPDHRAIGQTHRRGRGDSTPGRRYQRGVEAGPLGARGAGSLLLGAGLGAPHLRAGPAQQEKSGCGRLESRVPPPPGERRQGCQVSSPRAAPPERKGGHCLPDWQYCSIVWPRPFPATAGSLPSPRPPGGVAGVGGCHSDPGSECVLTLFPITSSSAQHSEPLLAVSASPRLPGAGATPPGLCFTGFPLVRSVVSLTHIRIQSRGPLFRGAVPTQPRMAP